VVEKPILKDLVAEVGRRTRTVQEEAVREGEESQTEEDLAASFLAEAFLEIQRVDRRALAVCPCQADRRREFCRHSVSAG
jgi:hypothetical protein